MALLSDYPVGPGSVGALVSSCGGEGGSVGSLVGSGSSVGSFVGSGSWVGAGSVVDVDGGGAVVAAGGEVPEGTVGVSCGGSFGLLSSVGWNVPIAVRKMGVAGVAVSNGAPAWINGQSCRETGNCRQLVLSAHMFRLNEVCCSARQIRIRCPSTTLAV